LHILFFKQTNKQTKEDKKRRLHSSSDSDSFPVDRWTGTHPLIQLDNTSYSAFVSQFIIWKWQMASMRR